MVKVIVEGQTEQAVCKQVLKPHLDELGVTLSAELIGGRGGRRSFAVLTDHIRRTAKSCSGRCYVTTLFDYYALNSSWPDVRDIKKMHDAGICSTNLAAAIEGAMLEHVASEISSDTLWNGHFIPYIQLHELEALLFAGPREMAEAFGNSELKSHFQSILDECGSCENINDSPETAPSKRIMKVFPRYHKGKTDRAHAPRIMQHVGLERIRFACPRFGAWLEKLEDLGRAIPL